MTVFSCSRLLKLILANVTFLSPYTQEENLSRDSNPRAKRDITLKTLKKFGINLSIVQILFVLNVAWWIINVLITTIGQVNWNLTKLLIKNLQNSSDSLIWDRSGMGNWSSSKSSGIEVVIEWSVEETSGSWVVSSSVVVSIEKFRTGSLWVDLPLTEIAKKRMAIKILDILKRLKRHKAVFSLSLMCSRWKFQIDWVM